MDRGEWPVAITSLGGAAVATIVWRRQAQLHVTVVVKGSFAFVPDGAMTPIEPEPIARDERPDADGVGLSAAGDLAPYLASADVWLTGHLRVPPMGASPRDQERRPGTPTRPPVEPPAAPVRLGVFRESAALLDKSLEIPILDARAPRIPIGGMGPLSRHWPIRSRLLGAVDPRRLEGAILEIPEPFDWSYFQVAPLDQRIEWLHGDEWVVLKGMHPERDSLATRLPGAVGAARLYGQAEGLRRGRPLRLSADTLRIDVDRQICSVTWRGQFPVSGEDALAAMHLLAGVELPGRPLAWRDPFQSGPAAAPVQSQPIAATIAMSVASPVVSPIASSPPAASKGDPLGGTMDISAADAAVLLAGIVTPFQPEAGAEEKKPRTAQANARASRAVVARGPRVPVAVAYDPLAATADVDAEAAAQARAGYVTPFAAARVAAAPAHDPLGATADVEPEAAAQARAGHVTPFTPVSAAPAHDPLGATADVEPEAAAQARAGYVTPFAAAPISAAPARDPISAAPARDPLGATADVEPEAAAQARAGYVTPFAAASAPPAAQPHFEHADPIVPQDPADAPDFPSAPWEAPSPIEQAPPLRIDVAPPALSNEDDDSPKGLGAQFLAAMASARAQRGAA